MYTSVTDRQRRSGLCYLAAAIAVAAAGAVYEHFSHGVSSYYMIFAFMVPLLAGALPNLLVSFTGSRNRKDTDTDTGSSAAAGLQLTAVATLTAGSLVNGALEIYGTTNRLMIFYPAAGLALLAAALIAYALQKH